MPAPTPEVHHVAGIVGGARPTGDFHARALGLRFGERTVNFEDIPPQHRDFDAGGNPGTALTAVADFETDHESVENQRSEPAVPDGGPNGKDEDP